MVTSKNKNKTIIIIFIVALILSFFSGFSYGTTLEKKKSASTINELKFSYNKLIVIEKLSYLTQLITLTITYINYTNSFANNDTYLVTISNEIIELSEEVNSSLSKLNCKNTDIENALKEKSYELVSVSNKLTEYINKNDINNYFSTETRLSDLINDIVTLIDACESE